MFFERKNEEKYACGARVCVSGVWPLRGREATERAKNRRRQTDGAQAHKRADKQAYTHAHTERTSAYTQSDTHAERTPRMRTAVFSVMSGTYRRVPLGESINAWPVNGAIFCHWRHHRGKASWRKIPSCHVVQCHREIREERKREIQTAREKDKKDERLKRPSVHPCC